MEGIIPSGVTWLGTIANAAGTERVGLTPVREEFVQGDDAVARTCSDVEQLQFKCGGLDDGVCGDSGQIKGDESSTDGVASVVANPTCVEEQPHAVAEVGGVFDDRIVLDRDEGCLFGEGYRTEGGCDAGCE